MLSLNVAALTTVLTLVGALAVLLPQDRARAADDTITVRAEVDGGNNVVTIQRYYTYPGRWVTVGVFSRDEPPYGDVFSNGTMALAVEFVPEFRRSLPPVAGFHTGFRGGYLPEECSEYCAVITCQWGFRVALGPYYSSRIRNTLAQLFPDSFWALRVCDHGRLLTEGGLTSPPGMVTIEEFRAMISAALTASGESRALHDIPVMGTEENPIRSETTYVDIRVTWPSERSEDPTITVKARGGGQQQTIELKETTTIGIFSLAQQ